MVLRGSSSTTGVGSLVWACPPIDHPISRASASDFGAGLGSTGSAAREVAARKAGAGENAAAEAIREAMITFCWS